VLSKIDKLKIMLAYLSVGYIKKEYEEDNIIDQQNFEPNAVGY